MRDVRSIDEMPEDVAPTEGARFEQLPPTDHPHYRSSARPRRSLDVKTLGNILWLVVAGLWLAIGYVVAGVINCIFIITIPFGVQSFKLAGYALWPFGRMVVHKSDRDVALGCVGNAIWLLTGGFWLALGHLLAGLLLCLTVIGIPLGLASIKMAGLALAPFGKQIVPVGTVPASTPGSFAPPPELG